ncbi:MAG: glutamine-hydrolyzing carbamoyl-phosphate synthase small subunit, partial [archaeon]|nr:glutamine-hydrolyzing carbamoyl-phosphate synthase small subunit [archaeon]
MFSAPLRNAASARLAEAQRTVTHRRVQISQTARAAGSSSSSSSYGESDISLVLPDGSHLPGKSFGHYGSRAGELVFTTGMVGYPEAMTDPSYRGQILTFTYPMIGNYGVPAREYDELGLLKYYESDKIHVQGIVVQEYSREYSHASAVRSLSDWMKEESVPGIQGIDTRYITTRIRETGAMLAKLDIGGADLRFDDPNKRNLVAEVSLSEPRIYGNGPLKIIAVDCGIKNNIIRQLAIRGATVKVVPWDYDFNKEDYDGLFISNGPGDPSMATITINHLRQALQTTNKPIFGICLGNQLLAIAAGGSTYKLPYGNRGQNQPCMDTLTGRCLISSQNHGFAVDSKTLPPEWTEYFFNVNDGSNEGIIHKTKPFFTVQFHPEAKNGPTDPAYLFDMFMDKCRDYKSDPSNMTFYIPPMPRPDPPRVRKVLMLGSGGLQIGQAGEFDYSGSQAIKALKQEGIRSVLINPNIATVQTQAGLADAVYFSPLTMESVEEVIRKERPEGLFLGFGGQTALNLGVQMEQTGLLKRYGMKVLGTQVSAIMNAEDRELFNDRLAEIDVKVAESFACTEIEEAVIAANKIGYPVMVRAAYALGGLGSGFCNNDDEIRTRCRQAFACTPQVLVEKSLKGWKECEYEVVRDMYGNTVTVCNMENFDPMGIHTGESIVVAPSQTLTDDDYHWLREIAIKTVNHLQVVGE